MEVPYSIISAMHTLAKVLSLIVHSARGRLEITSEDGYTTTFILDMHDGKGEWIELKGRWD